jgi:uncharacterized protein YgiM (DUF1202 family)
MFLPRSLVLWLSALFLSLASAAHAQSMVSVDRPNVYLRAGPGTQHDAQWKLSRGYPLQVLARKSGWLQVRDFESDTGWILGRLTAPKPHFVVKVPVANVRSAPGTRHRIVARAEYGQVLRTLERRQGWVRVQPAKGPAGWVARRLLWGW